MKKIAFYAPVKPPDHPIPSGDREISRLLIKAMQFAGHDVTVASKYINYQKRPGTELFETRASGARDEANRLIAHYQAMAFTERPDIWFTYHTYCKAPDILGQLVSDALDIPYVTAEACRTRQNTDADWKAGRDIVQSGIHRAAINFCLKPSDMDYLKTVLTDMKSVLELPPFVDEEIILENSQQAEDLPFDNNFPTIITVGMMRPGKKRICYDYLAKALAHLKNEKWNLVVVGDGPERENIEAMFSEHSKERFQWAGLVSPEKVHELMESSDIFAWPGYQEPIGMVYLEAQALGLPVAAMHSLGVPTVVLDGKTGLLSKEGDEIAYADNLQKLLTDRQLRERLGTQGARHIHASHGIEAAAKLISAALERL
jgi:glycosyltransferase involved in cell wall biosynthesis